MTDKEFETQAQAYKLHQNEAKEATKKQENAEALLKAELTARGLDDLTVGAFTVSWKYYTKKMFNRKRFQLENPTLYLRYQDDMEVRQFTVR